MRAALTMPRLPARELASRLLRATLPVTLALGWRAAVGVGLALLCALQLLALARTPPLAAPAAIAITLAAGADLTLGAAELAAPQAERAHLALRRDLAGRWWAANVSGSHQLVLQRDGADHKSGAAARLRSRHGGGYPPTLTQEEAALFVQRCDQGPWIGAGAPALALLRALLAFDPAARPPHALAIARMLAAVRQAQDSRSALPTRRAA